MEKQIDEVCQMMRDYIKTGYSDVGLSDLLFELIYEISIAGYGDHQWYTNYFIQSLRRELKEPEVMNRGSNAFASFLQAKYSWEPLDE